MNQDLATSIIESLRSGIPTRDSTRNLINPSNSLHEKLVKDLDILANSQRASKGRLFWGQFGQGKTHELTLFEHTALDKGFAVSRITINRQLSGHRLDHLYTKLATSIRTPNSNLFGIRHALDTKTSEDLIDSNINNPDRYTHPLPALILKIYLQPLVEDRDLFYNALLGSPVPLSELRRSYNSPFPRFQERFVASRHSKSYFEVMADILIWCGYRGWVILIDELELIHRFSRLARMQAYQNLYWLLNWANSLAFPIYTVGAGTDSLSELWQAPQGQSRLPDRDLIPQLAEERYGVESGRAMKNFFEYARDNNLCPSVERMSQNDLINLLERIVEIHGISYGWQPEVDVNSVIRSQGNAPVRLHIRALIETLDMRYLGNRDFIPQISGLEELPPSEDESYFDDAE